MRLSDAIEQLNCTKDSILDRAIAGEICLYAPVLDEGRFEWTIELLEVHPVSRSRGRAFAAFFSLQDFVLLPVLSLEQLKIRGWAVLEDFICADKAIAAIESWKSDREQTWELDSRSYKVSYSQAHERSSERRMYEETLSKLMADVSHSVAIDGRNGQGMQAANPSESAEQPPSFDEIYRLLNNCAGVFPWIPSRARKAIDDVLRRNGKEIASDYKVTDRMLRLSVDDFIRLKNPNMPNEMKSSEIDVGWKENKNISLRLKILIGLAERWRELPHDDPRDLDEYIAFTENTEAELMSFSAYAQRKGIAKFAAGIIRPLYSRRSPDLKEGRLFECIHSPELQALYRAAGIWDSWYAGAPAPEKEAVAKKIQDEMRKMGLVATNGLLEHGPKILQPPEADTGRETQRKITKNKS